MTGLSNHLKRLLDETIEQATKKILNQYVNNALSYHHSHTNFLPRADATEFTMMIFDLYHEERHNTGGSFKSARHALREVEVVKEGMNVSFTPTIKLHDIEIGLPNFDKINEIVENKEVYFTSDQLLQYSEIFEALERYAKDPPGYVMPREYLAEPFRKEMLLGHMVRRIASDLTKAGFKQK